MKSCFFIGHRELDSDIGQALGATILYHIDHCEVREFVVGMYGEFDRMVAKELCKVKRDHAEISLLLLSPYHPSERTVDLPKGFDSVFYPPGMERVPKRYAIARANRYMVENSDYLIAYAKYAASNAREVYEYALRREKKNLMKVTNLAK